MEELLGGGSRGEQERPPTLLTEAALKSFTSLAACALLPCLPAWTIV